MTITGWGIYWITRLDALRGLLSVVMILSGVMAFVVFWLLAIEEGENPLNKGIFRFFLIMFVSTMLLLPFLPSTKEMIAIKVLPSIVNNKDLQEIPIDMIKLTKEWLANKLEGEKR